MRSGKSRDDHRDRVRAGYLAKRLSHRLCQPLRPIHESILDEMRQHLGIGLGPERMALLQQRITKLDIVFDDPIVDHRDVAAAVGMWMSIGIVRSPMSSPAGMPDSSASGRLRDGYRGAQILQISCRLAYFQRSLVGDDGDSGRVIASIL